MADYILSASALEDIRAIGDYTKDKWSEERAEIYVRMLLAECRELAYKPLLGRDYKRFRPGLRGYPCGKHVIFYRILNNGKIRIVRILHERMDFLRKL